MSKPLPKKLRAKWDALIETEGKKLGLENCRPFLENKMVNDIFYEGIFKGRPCVVKCSSKAPDSIRNEYEMLKRLWEVDKDVFPEPYLLHEGDFSFFVMEKIFSGNATCPSADILRIAKALDISGIVHRDVSMNNLIAGSDNHLKLIDFQFAIDRADYRESNFMQKHPTYLHVTFGYSHELGLGKWNDILGQGLLHCLDILDSSALEAKKELSEMSEKMSFSI